MTSVMMTADTVGGVWTYVLELADALAGRGVEVRLATMGSPMSRQQRRELEASAVAEARESTFALEWTDEPWVEVGLAGEWLLDLEQQWAPDLVHLNGYVHGALPWRAPVLVVGHSCVLSWWQEVRGRPAPPAWDGYRRRVAAGLAAAGAVVAPTQAMADALGRCYGVSDVSVIANCRQPRWVADIVKEPLVMSAGRLWDEAKNLALVDQVAARLPWPVVIAGDMKRPEAAAAGPWASGAAELLGPLPFDQLAGWLMRASVFVHPARYEPFGLTALEAGLAGCALVLGDIPSLRQVWGDAAIFVGPGDEQGLVRAVCELAGDAGLLVEMAGRARRRAMEFSPERCAAGYLDAYECLLARAGSPA